MWNLITCKIKIVTADYRRLSRFFQSQRHSIHRYFQVTRVIIRIYWKCSICTIHELNACTYHFLRYFSHSLDRLSRVGVTLLIFQSKLNFRVTYIYFQKFFTPQKFFTHLFAFDTFFGSIYTYLKNKRTFLFQRFARAKRWVKNF